MKWNVFYYDINKKKIDSFNVFDHYSFARYVKKHLKECITKEEFADKLKSELQYFFWAKAEWEVIIAPWVGGNREKDAVKIDVYAQVMNNGEAFVDYVWSNRENY